MTTALPRVRPLVLKRRTHAFDNPDWLFEFYRLIRIFPALAERVTGQRMLDRALEVGSAEWLPQQLVGAILE
jgi:hypothetical protein